MRIASRGIESAARESKAIVSAVNIHHGEVTNQAVADCFGLPYRRWPA
jgi:alanine dehydrogenase